MTILCELFCCRHTPYLQQECSAEENVTNTKPLIVCLDVDYRPDGAVAAGLWFRGWASDTVLHQVAVTITDVADYEPGAFYRRELPCLLQVLTQGPTADIVIVDGYVWLQEGKPGLGAHLHQIIGGIVVGVAKTRFHSATDALSVTRGESSQSPLFVSAVGLPVQEVATNVIQMHGPYRVPTLLKQVDHLARTAELAPK